MVQTIQDPEETSARHDLIAEYMRYVRNLARMMINSMDLPKQGFDDLVAGGMLGLVEAAERFDFASGSNFKGFAFHRIRGAMIDSIRRSSDFSGKAYRAARAFEACSSLREESRHVRSAQEQQNKKQRLDEILNLAAEGALAYRLSFADYDDQASSEAQNQSNPELLLGEKESTRKISHLLETLPEKERLIVEEYYFHGMSFTEITEKYPNLSKSWVSKLHKRALQILRKRMLEAWGEEVA